MQNRGNLRDERVVLFDLRWQDTAVILEHTFLGYRKNIYLLLPCMKTSACRRSLVVRASSRIQGIKSSEHAHPMAQCPSASRDSVGGR